MYPSSHLSGIMPGITPGPAGTRELNGGVISACDDAIDGSDIVDDGWLADRLGATTLLVLAGTLSSDSFLDELAHISADCPSMEPELLHWRSMSRSRAEGNLVRGDTILVEHAARASSRCLQA